VIDADATRGADLLRRQRPVPAAQMVPSVPRPRQGGRDRPLGRLLPVIFVWIMIAAAAVIVIASALALIPRDVRTFRSGDAPRAPAPEETTPALEAA